MRVMPRLRRKQTSTMAQAFTWALYGNCPGNERQFLADWQAGNADRKWPQFRKWTSAL